MALRKNWTITTRLTLRGAFASVQVSVRRQLERYVLIRSYTFPLKILLQMISPDSCLLPFYCLVYVAD